MSTRKDKSIVPRPDKSSQGEIQAFLDQLEQLPQVTEGGPGRLVFAIDATASRQPTWDMACQIQGEMFSASQHLGGLRTQLCYYRGFHEFHTSPWFADTQQLLQHMTAVQCLGGQTQIRRLLEYLRDSHRQTPINAAIFIGDAVEEPADKLCQLAGELGLRGLPLFIFHEGGSPQVARVFQQMGKLSGGACCPFDSHSAQRLAALLGAVAVYASGGRQALEQQSSAAAVMLLEQLTKGQG